MVTSLVQLVCRLTKLTWFQDEQFTRLVDDSRTFLEKGSSGAHWSISCATSGLFGQGSHQRVWLYHSCTEGQLHYRQVAGMLRCMPMQRHYGLQLQQGIAISGLYCPVNGVSFMHISHAQCCCPRYTAAGTTDTVTCCTLDDFIRTHRMDGTLSLCRTPTSQATIFHTIFQQASAAARCTKVAFAGGSLSSSACDLWLSAAAYCQQGNGMHDQLPTAGRATQCLIQDLMLVQVLPRVITSWASAF